MINAEVLYFIENIFPHITVPVNEKQLCVCVTYIIGLLISKSLTAVKGMGEDLYGCSKFCYKIIGHWEVNTDLSHLGC